MRTLKLVPRWVQPGEHRDRGLHKQLGGVFLEFFNFGETLEVVSLQRGLEITAPPINASHGIKKCLGAPLSLD